MLTRNLKPATRVLASSLAILLPALAGCTVPTTARNNIVGTWHRTDELYRNIITYHSDGTWAMTCQVRPPAAASQPDDAPSGFVNGLVRAVAGGASRGCSGTWRIVDGRLVTTVTGSAMQEVPVGLARSDELTTADAQELKLRQQDGELLVWTKQAE